MRRRHGLALTLAAACGCADTTAPLDATVPGDGPPPSVEVGTGQDGWVDIPPSGQIQLIHGPQGGWMVFGRARLRGFTPDVFLTFTVTPGDGGRRSTCRPSCTDGSGSGSPR